MVLPLDEKIKDFAATLGCPLYVVGGYVRNFILNGAYGCEKTDVDLCSAMPQEEFLRKVREFGFTVKAAYNRTGTVLFSWGDTDYEYTAFRRDSYFDGGFHKPKEVVYTDDVKEDYLRRDFKCNALYYDITAEKVLDFCGGTDDIKNRVLSTVADAERTFSEDGLRLLRLARFAGELGFSVSAEATAGARKYAANVKNVSAERIYAELQRILAADTKYTFSPEDGHYRALKVAAETGVFDQIFPFLALGRGMSQRKDFHKYDVLEHSLRTVLYAPRQVRLAALLHDAGKPYCKLNFSSYSGHQDAGAVIAKDVLQRLKTDKKTVAETCRLIKTHMFDIAGENDEKNIRRFIVDNYDIYDKILLIKQADFRAGLDSDGVCPTVKRLTETSERMVADGTPFSVRELNINATTLRDIGFNGKEIKEEQTKLFYAAVENPSLNVAERLFEMAKADFRKKRRQYEQGRG